MSPTMAQIDEEKENLPQISNLNMVPNADFGEEEGSG